MSGARRLSICYVVPGHDLLASVGPSRNVLSLARSLGRHADVTVAFRRVAEADVPVGLRAMEIQPAAASATIDDSAMRGVSIAEFLRFMSALRRFVNHELRAFDVVLEKSWLLSGYISSLCRRRGQLGIPVENIVPNSSRAARGQLMKLMRLKVGGWIAGHSMRRAPLVIAETEFLRNEISTFWKIPRERIAVVDLGVDRSLFHPIDQNLARESFGIDAHVTMLTYVGVLDFTHDLAPAIKALGVTRPPGTELHVVGDGQRAAEYRKLADDTQARVVFHGRVAHSQVPAWIAASDVCLAPYDASVFASGELGYATMKIPEYLSVGRPVASVPSGRVASLVEHGVTGFLFENDLRHWMTFLTDMPPRARLQQMGMAAAATRLQSWDDTADAYLANCERLLAVARQAPE
jgi:glycosyltransferase involved in cell wall biosynthesis